MKQIAMLIMALATAALLYVPAGAESVLLNGQKHYYTVQLRSDKRAIVYARIIFDNPSADKDLTSYEYSLPSGVSIQNSSAQQILAKSTDVQTCKTYETLDQWRVRMNNNKNTSNTYPDTSYPSTKQCAEWQTAAQYDNDYDYDQSLSSSTNYYYSSYYKTRDTKFDYNDLTQTNNGSNYTVTLSQPVKPKKQGSILVSFTTSNFVTGGLFGRYDYNVRTLLAKQMIDKATVSVNFDDDMFTREAEQKRAYEPTTSDISLMSGANSASGNSYQSKSLDNLISSAGKGGIYVKTQSSLLPGDTLSVMGVFGTNSFVLYGNEFLITLLGLALIGIAIRIYTLWRKANPRKAATHVDGASVVNNTSHSAMGVIMATNANTAWAQILITSVASIVGTIILAIALASMVIGSSTSSAATGILTAFGLVIVIFFGAVLLPALYMVRHGINNVFKWALVQLVVIVILLLIFAALASSQGTPTPMYN